MARSLRYLQPNSLQNIVPAGLGQSLRTGGTEFGDLPGCRRRRPISFAWATRLGGWRTLSSANATVSNAAPATPQKARFRGASGRLDSLGKGFLERVGSATKWYHSPAPLRGGPAGRSAGELVNNPEERDGLRDLPAGPGQPVQMPGMWGRALFALYEGAPEESLLAARTAAAGPLPLPGR